MFSGIQDSISAALTAELGVGNLLEGITSVAFSDCPRTLPTQAPALRLNWSGAPDIDWGLAKGQTQLNVSNLIDVNLYVISTESQEAADRELMDLILDAEKSPATGILPVLANLARSGIQAGSQRWAVTPGQRITTATIGAKGRFCVAASILLRARACLKFA